MDPYYLLKLSFPKLHKYSKGLDEEKETAVVYHFIFLQSPMNYYAALGLALTKGMYCSYILLPFLKRHF